MPNYYEIAPTDDTLTLRDGKAEASYTVRYVGGRTVEARAQVVALNGASDDWLEVEPPATRAMAADQTHNIKVKVAVPPGTPAGDYALRLDMVSVDNTDEEYDKGPSISFRVEDTPAPEPDPPAFPWWLVILVAVILVLGIGGITWYLNSGNGEGLEPVTVEDWLGTYGGRLDGRNASLRIEADEAAGQVIFAHRDLDRNADKNGEAPIPSGPQAHIIKGPFGDPNEMFVLHRHDRDLISMLGKWRGVSFGRVYQRGGFDRAPGRNFDDDRWKAFWRGTFNGFTDGLESQLKTSVSGDSVNLTLDVTGPDSTTRTYSGSARLNTRGDPKWMHVLEDVRLTASGNQELTIDELLIHTWGSNYMTGIAITGDGDTVGQIFIRETDVPDAPRFEVVPMRPELILERITPIN